MFKKLTLGQEASFKGNSGEWGLFSNGGADLNGRWVVLQIRGFNTPYALCIIYIHMYKYIYIYIHIYTYI